MQAIYVNAGCHKCILGINPAIMSAIISPANKIFFAALFILYREWLFNTSETKEDLLKEFDLRCFYS